MSEVYAMAPLGMYIYFLCSLLTATLIWTQDTKDIFSLLLLTAHIQRNLQSNNIMFASMLPMFLLALNFCTIYYVGMQAQISTAQLICFVGTADR
jgi:hypothetical protein